MNTSSLSSAERLRSSLEEAVSSDDMLSSIENDERIRALEITRNTLRYELRRLQQEAGYDPQLEPMDSRVPWYLQQFHIDEAYHEDTKYTDAQYEQMKRDSVTKQQYYLQLLDELHKKEEEIRDLSIAPKASAVATQAVPHYARSEEQMQQALEAAEAARQDARPCADEVIGGRRSFNDILEALRFEEQVLAQQRLEKKRLEREQKQQKQQTEQRHSRWYELKDRRFNRELTKVNKEVFNHGYEKTQFVTYLGEFPNLNLYRQLQQREQASRR